MRTSILFTIAVSCLLFMVHSSVADDTANEQNITPVVSLLLSDTEVDCDDENVCTDDTYDPSIGCVHTNNTAPCDDGSVCTENDTCSAGSCTGGTPLSCDDGNVCTDDFCDVVTGCFNIANTAPCNDLNGCTEDDTCSAGTCQGVSVTCPSDGLACTSEVCSSTGSVAYTCIIDIDPGWCLISNSCYSDGTFNPNNECLMCDVPRDQEDWSSNDGTPCDDGDPSTTIDICDAYGECIGLPEQLFPGINQQNSLCKLTSERVDARLSKTQWDS